MGAALAVAAAVQKLGVVVVTGLAAGTVLARGSRSRALSMALALGLAPVLLLGQVYDTPQFRPVRHHPALAAAAALVLLAAVAAGAVLFVRRPSAFPLVAVAALPFRVPIQAGGGTANLLVPLYLVVAAGGLAFVAARLRGTAPPEPPGRAHRLQYALLGFLLLYALQALYSPNFPNALQHAVFFYVPFILLFALLADVSWTPAIVHRCFGVLLGLALTFTAIGFVEYATRRLLLNPKVIDSNQFETYFRVNSLFFDPNIYGRFLVLVMLGLVATMLWTARRSVVVAAMAALGVLLAGLVVTFSQSSFGALLVGLATIAGLRWSVRWTVWLSSLAVLLTVAFVVAAPGAVRLNLQSSQSLNRSTSGRFALIRGGAELFTARPVAGWGSGSFGREYRAQRKGSSARAVSASHTTPLTVAAEQGTIGLIAYLALLAAAFAVLLRGARRRATAAALAAAFGALVFHTLLYADFLEDPFTWALLGVGVGLARREAAIPAPGAVAGGAIGTVRGALS